MSVRPKTSQARRNGAEGGIGPGRFDHRLAERLAERNLIHSWGLRKFFMRAGGKGRGRGREPK